MAVGDRDLVRRCRRGNREAMEELVERYYDQVLNFAARFVGRTETARDVAQDVFVKVVGRLGSYDERADLRTWIFAITANTCRDQMRRMKRRREVLEADGPELYLISDLTEDTDVAGSPERALERRARAGQVRRAVAELPEIHRATVVLRFFHDLSLKEIAEILGCSVGTVGSRLHYAVKRLNGLLDGELDDVGGELDAMLGGESPTS
jgi:RNA polymerase sigma-70 factor, ECF subfamily